MTRADAGEANGPPREGGEPEPDLAPRCFRLRIEYDGTDFEGWQVQKGDARTVQGSLCAALARLGRGPVRVVGAGRTDAGVHAEGQVAAARLATRLPPEALRRALNAHLPRDVGVLEVAPAAPDFDPRRAARRKLYRYQIWNGRDRSPLRARRWAPVHRRLEVGAMARAAAALEGRHDFTSFRAAGSSVKTSVRTLFRAEVAGEPGGEIVVELEGDGFLRHMVRNVVGTLVEVGHGARSPEGMPALLAARDRGLAGPTAPARGLTLVRVDLATPDDTHSI
ncbi:MAG: tRNA pseudouridine(38-40) synthase TruA [Myxococcota bacterium]